LAVERGLAPETVRYNTELARRFLTVVSDEQGSVGQIAGGDVTTFLLA
jgi:outer membrane lipoprotein SlyB